MLASKESCLSLDEWKPLAWIELSEFDLSSNTTDTVRNSPWLVTIV
ncbi:hypothetical protein [Methylomonas albis]|nr:hypothetical protein [Methylomonas albis]